MHGFKASSSHRADQKTLCKSSFMKLCPFLGQLGITGGQLACAGCSYRAGWAGRMLGLGLHLPAGLNTKKWVTGTERKKDLPHFHTSLSILIHYFMPLQQTLFLDTFGQKPAIFFSITLAWSVYDSRSLGLSLISTEQLHKGLGYFKHFLPALVYDSA